MPPTETPLRTSVSAYIGGAVLIIVVAAMVFLMFSSRQATSTATQPLQETSLQETVTNSAPSRPTTKPNVSPKSLPGAAPTAAPKPPGASGAAAVLAAETIDINGTEVAKEWTGDTNTNTTDPNTDEYGNHWDESIGAWISPDGLIWMKSRVRGRTPAAIIGMKS